MPDKSGAQCYSTPTCISSMMYSSSRQTRVRIEQTEDTGKRKILNSPRASSLLQSTPLLPYELQLQLPLPRVRTDRELPLPFHFSLPDFNLFHMIAVGLSSSILGCLVTLLVYSYCQRYQQQSHDATVIHPISAAPLNTSITNHINKLDKYDSVEAIKVCGQVCAGGGGSLRVTLDRTRRAALCNMYLLFDLIYGCHTLSQCPSSSSFAGD